MKTKDRIVLTSIELFNKNGVVAVTTNHIAKELGMSPGNLYFHYANKEEIIRSIFSMMCVETYKLWRMKKGQPLVHPLDLIEKNFEIFWKYRFFHREMYYLRKKDPQLGRMWRAYVAKVLKLMNVLYRRWLKAGWMKPIESIEETEFITSVLLATASTFLQFFESADRQPTRKHVDLGKIYVARLLVHWTQGTMEQDFNKFISSSSKTST